MDCLLKIAKSYPNKYEWAVEQLFQKQLCAIAWYDTTYDTTLLIRQKQYFFFERCCWLSCLILQNNMKVLRPGNTVWIGAADDDKQV